MLSFRAFHRHCSQHIPHLQVRTYGTPKVNSLCLIQHSCFLIASTVSERIALATCSDKQVPSLLTNKVWTLPTCHTHIKNSLKTVIFGWSLPLGQPYQLYDLSCKCVAFITLSEHAKMVSKIACSHYRQAVLHGSSCRLASDIMMAQAILVALANTFRYTAWQGWYWP